MQDVGQAPLDLVPALLEMLDGALAEKRLEDERDEVVGGHAVVSHELEDAAEAGLRRARGHGAGQPLDGIHLLCGKPHYE